MGARRMRVDTERRPAFTDKAQQMREVEAVNVMFVEWNKVMTTERRTVVAARTQGQLVTAVGDAMRSVTPDDCRGFFTGCGYNGTH